MLLLALPLASGCGTARSSVPPTTTATATRAGAQAGAEPCILDTLRAKRWLPRLHADIARIRRATTHEQTSRATDRFINDYEHAGLSLRTEIRLIDHAVAAVNGKCADCFQALEPMHPKPSIAMHDCH